MDKNLIGNEEDNPRANKLYKFFGDKIEDIDIDKCNAYLSQEPFADSLEDMSKILYLAFQRKLENMETDRTYKTDHEEYNAVKKALKNIKQAIYK